MTGLYEKHGTASMKWGGEFAKREIKPGRSGSSGGARDAVLHRGESAGCVEEGVLTENPRLDLEHLFQYNDDMFLLPARLKHLLKQKKGTEETRIFLQDQEMVTVVRKVARQQGRSEEEIIADFAKAGLNQFLIQNEMEERWSSLSPREQQVAALVCLGHKNHEIAEILAIAPDTVKTHLQRIFAKFNLRSSKELRLALKNWNFARWWEYSQNQG